MNYRQIIDSLTEEKVKSILDKLQIPYEDKGTYLVMPTVCHNSEIEEASHKLYYYKNNKIFMCFTECQSMSIFKFLKNYYTTRQIEYDWYNDIYDLIVTDFCSVEGFTKTRYEGIKEKYSKKKKDIELPQYNKNVLECFVKKYPVEWLNDNISKEAMDKYNILFSISQNKIIIPHYDINGNLCGIRGRALNEEEVNFFGKYMPVQIENIWYKHPLSMNLYGLYQNKENINRTGICYVFESEKSVMQFESFKRPNCAVAVCGSQFNKYQLYLLMKHCSPKEIVICFDREEKEGEDKYFNKLWNICEKYKNYCNFSFIYDRMGITKMKDSPTDNGEEVFKQLLEKRVMVR